MKEAGKAAAAFCDEKVLADEASLVDFFKSEGLSVYQADGNAFQEKVIAYYKENGIADAWDADLYQAIQDLGAKY